MGFPLSIALKNLQKGKAQFEVAVLAREGRMMTDDAAVGEGFSGRLACRVVTALAA